MTKVYHSPLGDITIASADHALVGLWFEDQKYFGSTMHMEDQAGSTDVLEQVSSWLDAYFSGNNPDWYPAIQLHGTSFQQCVWHVLQEIPYGKTMTYGEIARIVAQNTGASHVSARAVGGAVGHNPVSILVPCHRVVGSNGSLTGYAGGIDRKQALLQLEGMDISKLYVPKRGSV